MLILQRKEGQAIYIGDDIVITLVSSEKGRARIAIQAPSDVSILREELREAQAANQEAAAAAEDAAQLIQLIHGDSQ